MAADFIDRRDINVKILGNTLLSLPLVISKSDLTYLLVTEKSNFSTPLDRVLAEGRSLANSSNNLPRSRDGDVRNAGDAVVVVSLAP